MSQQFVKSLECHCIAGLSGTCGGGGSISAKLTVKPAALKASIKTNSKITSPGEKLSVSFARVTGDGPLYVVEGCSGSDCNLTAEGWQVTITGTDDSTPFSITTKALNRYENGSLLILENTVNLTSNTVTVSSITANGVAHKTKPKIIRTKGFVQTVSSLSEISSRLNISEAKIYPKEQALDSPLSVFSSFFSFRANIDVETVDDPLLRRVTLGQDAVPIDRLEIFNLARRNGGTLKIETTDDSGTTVAQTFTIVNVENSSQLIIKPQNGDSYADGIFDNPLSIATIFTTINTIKAIVSTGHVSPTLTANYSVGESFTFTGNLRNTYTDKVAGDFSNYGCVEKLYPSADLPIASGFGGFVSPTKSDQDLYTQIDEGVYNGVLQDKGDASLVSDDTNTYIIPNTVHTEGFFQYKCQLSNFNVRPEETRLHMRVSAPIENYESKIPPQYTIYNIRLQDPSGNLIVKYNDITLRGDALSRDHANYTTYSSAPEINVVTEKYGWQRQGVVHLQEKTGYSLTFSVKSVAFDDAFTEGFDEGFEENYIIPDIITDKKGNNYLALDGTPLSSHENRFINPTDGFKISAIEICNSGSYGPGIENYLPVRIEMPIKGRRLERSILPTFMPLYDFDTSIYPSVTTTWQDTKTSVFDNTDKCGSEELVKILRDNNENSSITLSTAVGGGVADSGKLTLKFSHTTATPREITKGAFNIAFDQGTKNTWWQPSGSFNVENTRTTSDYDIPFFAVDSLTLKVLAKKEAGSRDYALDVVGYSDDGLLEVTSASGGFIQDPSEIHLNDLIITQDGQYPTTSGFRSDNDDLSLGGTSISEKEKYFTASGNDHYKLTQYPYVTGTDFELYEIPLQINSDTVKYGLSKDYTLSSLFEHLYLDIFPIPSGASIAHISLDVRYNPQNGMNLATRGGIPVDYIQPGRSEAALFPSYMRSNDDIINAGSGYAPLSRIENIPHAYSSEETTLKSNYSRRWRGVEGTVRGPYDPDSFSFSFENPVMDYPFLSGYFKFDNLDNRYVKSVDLGDDFGTVSGLAKITPEVYHNIGWRFSSGTLFADHLPNYSGNYTTTDWTSLSKAGDTFVGNPMYGKIADAFDRVIRLEGNTQNINFGNIDTTSGFSIFTRFTPDSNISGVGYDLFESGVIFSKWEDPNSLDFALGFKGGFICGYAKNDEDGSIVEVVDTIPYSGYSYPLNVLLTYNDNQSSGLKLYIDNESVIHPIEAGDFSPSYETPYILRASSSKFYKRPNNADLVLGYSAGSGVGMNMLVSEFGISTWSSGVDTLYGSGTNIVESNPDATYKRVTADKFFENLRVTYFDPSTTYGNDRYKLWDRVNEDTYNDWSIGAFKHCPFSFAFDSLQKRPNREQIVFDINHHGSGYMQSADLSMPSTVNSGASYHTQIENDFLRFHLSDVPDNFNAADKRISKNLPVGYKFNERALVVESVIEHKTQDSIVWSDCDNKVGPKLIVSLYTKNQEPYFSKFSPNQPNWGLVNRKSHYLEPSSCLIRLDSTFSYEDLDDDSEKWSIFPDEPRTKEFKERYFSKDVDDMFVQYDLVYPSGPSFNSRIELHSSHVRMEHATVKPIKAYNTANLFASGGYPSQASMNLVVGENPEPVSGMLPLLMNVPIPVDVSVPSGFTLNVSGAYTTFASMNLYTPNFSGVGFLNLHCTSGMIPSSAAQSMFLSLPSAMDRISLGDDSVKDKELTYPDGFSSESAAKQEAKKLGLSGSHRNETTGKYFPGAASDWDENSDGYSDASRLRGPFVPLFVLNSDIPNSGSLPLYGFWSSGDAIRKSVNLYLHNELAPSREGPASGDLNMVTVGINKFQSIIRRATLPLFIHAPNVINGALPLTIGYSEQDPVTSTGQMNLFTANYPVGAKGVGSAYGLWSNENFGTGIELQDNYLASISVSNEIRGVDLIAYGSCDGNSDSKAIDKALETDDVIWREAVCNDGGIFRAKDTYTNSGAINFEGGFGYSGNYYGVRKFTQLLPNMNYDTTVTIKTGSTDPIKVPRTFEEWEYGMCGPNWDADGCCTEDCDQDIVFSGVKLVADDSNLVTDPALLVASGRNIDDKYGYKVSVKGDLMAVSAPNLDLPDYSPYDSANVTVPNAGAVFLYRRGADTAGKKAGWSYENILTLPDGYRKDYVDHVVNNLIKFDDFSISGNKWQIGQEGRRFGESLDMCSSGDRETVVVGAPRASWSRTFTDITTSGVPCGTLIVADLFSYNPSDYGKIASAAKKFDILWKYFSAPWYTDCSIKCVPEEQQFYPRIEMKSIVLQVIHSHKNRRNVPKDTDLVVHKYINRLDDYDLVIKEGSGVLNGVGTRQDFFASGQPVVFSGMVNTMKEAFTEAFPGNDSSLLYSGIPAIFGMFKEQTGSTAGALSYRDDQGVVHSLYSEFEKFYKQHSYASGVFDQTTGLKASGHLNTITGKSENWASSTVSMISDTFDSGRLSTTFTDTTLNRNFITSGVGQEWGDTHSFDVRQFQVPPESGGRVYIFEKERDNFNCVQIITSPNDTSSFGSSTTLDDYDFYLGYGKKFNDRFGHSVAISKNSEVISIGSPFTTSPCRVYERDDAATKKVYDNVKSWIDRNNKTDAAANYDAILAESGISKAQTSAYDHLSASERFAFRNDKDFWNTKPPALYKLVYKYDYSSISYRGTRQFLPGHFAPTSRLGWSTSVSDEGNMVAFGAPTDSFNLYEDANVYAENLDYWASFQYAGAVRTFKARKYYPHSGVVEFGRFGNLDRSLHPAEREAGNYDEMQLFFNEGADGTSNYARKHFRRTDFSEIEIPQDAGLAFIITPEIDAASDEIIDNIKNWLALGDRNLVLVGNDPVWEENGIYKPSNDIINKILEKLKSRMRILPAKSRDLSLPDCVSEELKNDQKYNITTSFKPARSTDRTVKTGNYYAKGVGDIRIDLSQDKKQDHIEYMHCPEGGFKDGEPVILNSKCEFPQKHSGDLRAEWIEECVRTLPNGSKRKIQYPNNWALQFGTFVPDCDIPPKPLINRKTFEPIPLLTTAEHLPDRTIRYPDTSGLIDVNCRTITTTKTYETNTPFAEFEPPHVDHLSFNIREDSSSTLSGKFSDFDIGSFKDPQSKNGRDAILQGDAVQFTPDVSEYKTITLYDKSPLAVVESGRNINNKFNNSRAYLIATQWSEDDGSRGIAYATDNEDKNTEFYINLVAANCKEAPVGVHLGGWTGNTSLENAYYNGASFSSSDSLHSLADKFRSEFTLEGGSFEENKTYEDFEIIDPSVDFVWIANPESKPSDLDINRIRNWMNTGDKKLIVTYSASNHTKTQKFAQNVNYICDQLNISSRPFFVPQEGEYFISDDISSWGQQEDPTAPSEQRVNYQNKSIQGCETGFDFSFSYNESTAVSGLHFSKETKDMFGVQDMDLDGRSFVPISGGANYENIIWFPEPITTRVPVNPDPLWKIKHDASVTFPAIPYSGYKLFFEWVSETKVDNLPISVDIEGARFSPRPCHYFPLLDQCKNASEFDDPQFGDEIQLEETSVGVPARLSTNVIPTGDTFTVNFSINWGSVPKRFVIPDSTPATVRLLSVSGYPLPIESGITTKVKTVTKSYTTCDQEYEVTPGYDVTIPGISRPVKHKSELYCNPDVTEPSCMALGNELIEDGPVVAAEEFETFSSFPNGVRRSKIIVISDSTMIQGQCDHYRSNATLSNTNATFIRGLYPPSPYDNNNPQDLIGFNPDEELEEINLDGRKFEFSQKLRAAERGSVAKYHAVSGASVPNMTEPLYNGLAGSVGSLGRFVDSEDEINPSTLTRPDEIFMPEEIKNKIKNWGNDQKSEYGIFTRWSGDFLDYVTPSRHYGNWPGNPLEVPKDKNGVLKERNVILDAGIEGGLTDLMKLNNTDYLDLDIYESGCLGDLFGYSVDLSEGKLVVGTPFNAFHAEGAISGVSGIVQWHEIQNDDSLSGIKVAEDGGAGAAFYFEQTGSGQDLLQELLPWEFVSKIKPSSLNVGIYDFSNGAISALGELRGDHNLDDPNFITRHARKSDNFGVSVAIDSDMIAVGAPNHDFETLHHHIYSGSIVSNDLNTAFLRKSFNSEFDIPKHSFYDLGGSGIRVDKFSENSGTMILNNGAVFNYRHEMTDFQKRKKSWIFAEKINAQGYNDRRSTRYVDVLGTPVVSVSGAENDRFGWSVSIDRAKRGDSDYTLVAGAPYHDWPVSGHHPTSGLDNAGSAYTFDAMLREQLPTIPNSGGWLEVDVFAHDVDSSDSMKIRVYQNTQGEPKTYTKQGIVTSNDNGDIFLEGSGFDPSAKGFIAHRPYVESVKFSLASGDPAKAGMTLTTIGKPDSASGSLDLSIKGPDSSYVYNNMNLYQFGVSGSTSGSMNMYLEVASGANSGILNLNVTSTQTTGNLDLRIRGF